MIADVWSLRSPDGVKSAKPGLIVDLKQGKYQYSCLLSFIMRANHFPPVELRPRFIALVHDCGRSPIHFLLDVVGNQSFAMTRGGSRSHRSSSIAIPPSSRQASAVPGIPVFNNPSVNPFVMGQFSTPTQKMPSEERLAASSYRSDVLPPWCVRRVNEVPDTPAAAGLETSEAASATRNSRVRCLLARAAPLVRPRSSASSIPNQSRSSSCPRTAGPP